MSEAPDLSRRERQIMDTIHVRGRATVRDVLDDLDDSRSYSTVRTIIGSLVRKGHLRYKALGRSYVYSPVQRKGTAQRNALGHLLSTLFDNSPEKLMTTLVDMSERDLDDAQIQRLRAKLLEIRRLRSRT